MNTNAVRFLCLKLAATLAALLASGCSMPLAVPTNVEKQAKRCVCGCTKESCRCSECPVASLRTANRQDPSAGRAPHLTPKTNTIKVWISRNGVFGWYDMDVGTQPATAVNRRTIYVYAQPGSTVALDEIRSDLGSDFDIRVYNDPATFPAWLTTQAKQPGWGYPLLHWRTPTDSGKVMVWAGAEAFHAQDGVVKKKQPAQAADQWSPPDRRSGSGRSVETACSYPVRGSWWTHPGRRLNKADLIAHLQSGFHGGKFRLAYLHSLSPEELESLHSDDHEGRVRIF